MMPNLKPSQNEDAVLNAALEYADQGFSVIPVRRDTKRPYIKWEEFQHRIASNDEIEAWFEKWPAANVAIVCGKISGIFCVDADGQVGMDWVHENLPRTPVHSRTGKGFHAIYKIPADAIIRNAVRIRPEVDVRGEGGYFVAPPSTHANGHQYEWIHHEGGWDNLPEYQPPAYPAQTTAGGIDLSGVKASPVFAPVSKGERNNTLAQLAGKWVNLGLDEDEIGALARAWNAQNSPPLGDRELATTLKSIRNTHERKNPAPAVLTPSTISPSKNIFPQEALSPGGVLQELMEYIAAGATASSFVFNLAAAISFLGNILGQKVQTETGLRTNLYCVSLGYSGSGKNAPFGTLPQLLARTNSSETQGPTELTSATSLLRWLSTENHRRALLMLDEMGLIMRGVKNPQSPAHEIPRILTTLFSNTERPTIKSYADGSQIIVPWSHLSLYGASTPERFWENISPGDAVDGFLARVLIFESGHDAEKPKDSVDTSIPQSLIDALDAFGAIKAETSGGNLVNCPIPRIVPRIGNAAKLHQENADRYHDLKNQHKDDPSGISSLYGRAAEHAGKLALIYAMSKGGAETTGVLEGAVKWAWAIVDHVVSQAVASVKNTIVDTETGRWKQKILKAVAAHATKNPYPGASLRDLQRGACQGLNKRELNTLLDSLLSGEQLGYMTVPQEGGRWPLSYYFIPQEDQVSSSVVKCHIANMTLESAEKT